MSVIEKYARPAVSDAALAKVNDLGKSLAGNGIAQDATADNATQTSAPVSRNQLGRSLSQKPPGRSL